MLSSVHTNYFLIMELLLVGEFILLMNLSYWNECNVGKWENENALYLINMLIKGIHDVKNMSKVK